MILIYIIISLQNILHIQSVGPVLTLAYSQEFSELVVVFNRFSVLCFGDLLPYFAVLAYVL